MFTPFRILYLEFVYWYTGIMHNYNYHKFCACISNTIKNNLKNRKLLILT